MISYDDCPEVRELYADTQKWQIVPHGWKYCGRHARTKEDKERGIREKKVTGREVLIMNY